MASFAEVATEAKSTARRTGRIFFQPIRRIDPVGYLLSNRVGNLLGNIVGNIVGNRVSNLLDNGLGNIVGDLLGKPVG